jgi:uncharacterized protein YcbK (DUF882 family)
VPLESKTYGTENFSIKEMEYSCEIPTELLDNAQEVLENLQVLRNELKRPIKIIPGGGYRNPQINAQCKGAKDSQHLQAKASDIRVEGVTPTQVQQTILKLIEQGKMKKGGVGIYETFVHYDVRGTLTQWKG